jgi:hypothetical protein
VEELICITSRRRTLGRWEVGSRSTLRTMHRCDRMQPPASIHRGFGAEHRLKTASCQSIERSMIFHLRLFLNAFFNDSNLFKGLLNKNSTKFIWDSATVLQSPRLAIRHAPYISRLASRHLSTRLSQSENNLNNSF